MAAEAFDGDNLVVNSGAPDDEEEDDDKGKQVPSAATAHAMHC